MFIDVILLRHSSFVKMLAIKRETEESLCRGCLSTNRRLTPLTNFEMYFTLLGTKHLLDEYKYSNILLCWECQALLRRTQAFKRTLQEAQYLLTTRSGQISTEPLSTLKIKHKKDYDYNVDESIGINKAEVEKLNENNEEVVVKEEYIPHHFENDNIDSSHNDDIKEEQAKPSIKKKWYKKDTEKRELKKVESGIDINNPDKYFNEVRLSETEIEHILAKDRDEDVRMNECKTCGFRFINKTDLLNHSRSYHSRRTTPKKCSQCSFTYTTQWDLMLHCWRSHPVHQCSLCGRAVPLAKERAKHLELHRFRYRCLKCGVDFHQKYLYLYHEKTLHSRYKCDHCSRNTATKKALERHIFRRHLPHKCSACAMSFPNWERLRRHEQYEHSRGPAYCVECDITFVTPAKYRRHLGQSAKHKPKKRIRVPCPECGKVFSRKNYMNNHRKLFHSNQTSHHCPLCDKYYVNAFGLRTHHKFVHEKVRLPRTKMCGVCGRGFGTNRVLENHMRTHTGERPFACAHCSAAFAQRVALKAHLAAIHKEK